MPLAQRELLSAINSLFDRDIKSLGFEELDRHGNALMALLASGAVEDMAQFEFICLKFMHFAMKSTYANAIRPLVAKLEDAMFPDEEPSPPDLVRSIETLGASPLILRFIPPEDRLDVVCNLHDTSPEHGLGVLLDAALRTLDGEFIAKFEDRLDGIDEEPVKGGPEMPVSKDAADHLEEIDDVLENQHLRRCLDTYAPCVIDKLVCVFSLLNGAPEKLESMMYNCTFLQHFEPGQWAMFAQKLRDKRFRTIPSSIE